MTERGHTEGQIIAALKQQESGEKTADIYRRFGISEATFNLWKKQYAGLGVRELREMRQLREENNRLKRLVADLSLDRQILQETVAWSTMRYRQRKGLQEPPAPVPSRTSGLSQTKHYLYGRWVQIRVAESLQTTIAEWLEKILK